ncbi:MAG: flagellar motor protein MotB [Syntrophales bacterium]
MNDRPKPIIIKRVRKKKHGDHHGGQWKVAYADFVTAMMAFFLLMWLLAMVSPEKRAQLSEYFNNFTLFKESGFSFSRGGYPMFSRSDSAKELAKGKISGAASSEKLKKRLKAAVETKLKSMENQVIIDIHEGGVRIQIVDNEGSLMFPLGSAQPTDKAKAILALVAENIKDVPGKITIEGHTDSLPFRGDQITNWELSTSRASAARRELESNGIEPSRIAKVIGYADQELLVKEAPKDPRNRRISIIVPVSKDNAVIGETASKAIPDPVPSVIGQIPPPKQLQK